jgi:hypothetical protein
MAKDLAGELCDVFIGSTCLVLPDDATLVYKASFDSSVYRINDDERELIGAYVGHAPKPFERTASFERSVDDFRVVGYTSESDGNTKVDILFEPKKKTLSTIHIFANVPSSRRATLGRALAGLRVCRVKSQEEWWCPRTSDLGHALSKWVSK